MSTVYLVPCFLSDEATETIPVYVTDVLKSCQVIFAENERTARRFLKSLDKTFVIDDYEWHTIHKAEDAVLSHFKNAVQSNKIIAIISEAGCPGIADPGQILVNTAHRLGAVVRPLVGPSSILLALMASGLNGQQFEFTGYLPIDNHERLKKIKELETTSAKQNSTKIFIETPYRNQQLFEQLLQHCKESTQLCIGIHITSKEEVIKTHTVGEWKTKKITLHKVPVIFLLQA